MKRIIMILSAIAMLSMTALPVLAQEPLPPDPTLSGRFTAEPLGEFIIFDCGHSETPGTRLDGRGRCGRSRCRSMGSVFKLPGSRE